MKIRSRVALTSLLLLSMAVVALSLSVQFAMSSKSTHAPHADYASSPFQGVTSTTTSSTSTTNSTGPLWGVLDPLVRWVKSALTPFVGSPPHMPASTLLTVGLAVALGLTTSTVAKLMVDYDMVRNHMQEFNAWRKDLDKARKANDDQAVSKLMKKQQAMTKLQARASMESMKVTMVTFVPFLLLWYVLSAVFGQVTVAEAPFPLPLAGASLSFVSWYFLCSFAVNLPMMKAFGIGPSET